MTARIIDRARLKEETRELLRTAQVSPKGMTALYLLVSLALHMVGNLGGGLTGGSAGLLGTFVYVLASLIDWVLGAGFVLYCMAVRRGERAEYLTLFDGFSFVGKAIALNIVLYILIFLWSLLFIIPGVIAGYRYRFALYNLYENPDIGILEAISMSKRQTMGYKGQLFLLDLSYVGWVLLASLPLIVMEFLQSPQYLAALSGGSAGAALGTAVSLSWGWSLFAGLWSLAVALFYLAGYQCVELGYFETAKETSGVGLGASPRQDGGFWDNDRGPDGLGGL